MTESTKTNNSLQREETSLSIITREIGEKLSIRTTISIINNKNTALKCC